MKTSRNNQTETARERQRIKALRAQFQSQKPSLNDLISTGEYEGPVSAEEAWGVDHILSQLFRRRKAAGVTQRQLAQRIGMDVTALSRLESGRQTNVTLATLERLAKGLGYTLSVQMRPDPATRAA